MAENLPCGDEVFDAATTAFSVHQWSDFQAGLRETRRVARAPPSSCRPATPISFETSGCTSTRQRCGPRRRAVIRWSLIWPRPPRLSAATRG
ncbi:class I SAM-dependent methyltransferase [Streptomyces sp. NPDC004520]|uniref:class I SAM-dependent methyltransferase n=1 Tax=Streptomyces sp. NPDC004520 TaxID=3364702 RepID=UPI003696E398